ncbi:MAG: type I-C CRISPR-associated protein Cas5c [Bacteroidales bacterium]|nr:type I-C CRISPR-associated protein Cas5c [Bacteroidales bacterium]
MNQEYRDKEYCIEVRGDFACFTRPEMKVERVSYDVITPSAARNIFQAICWKKEAMEWEITRIEVLNPIKKMLIKRNEVGTTMSPGGVVRIEESRTQKSSYILRDVAYRIFARLRFIPLRERPGQWKEKVRHPEDENPGKYQGMFERRAEQGQCFTHPYLGCREFTCSFEYIKDAKYGQGGAGTMDLGYMLYDMDFKSDPNNPPAMFYHANMVDGVIKVPSPDSDEIRR